MIVYIQQGAEFDDLSPINSYPLAVEKSHELPFNKKPVICLFSDKNSYLRRTVTKARFYAYPNGNLVVSPWALQEAREGKISLECYGIDFNRYLLDFIMRALEFVQKT